MDFTISIHNVRRLDHGVWVGETELELLEFLKGDATPPRATRSVVLVKQPDYDAGTLVLSPSGTTVASLGRSPVTIFVDVGHRGPGPKRSRNGGRVRESMKKGDSYYLAELGDLPDPLRQAGTELLRRVRSNFPGELVFHPKSKKYVNRPNNFVVFRIQPVDESIRVMVYGRPEDFRPPPSLGSFSAEMGAYASFKLRSLDQVDDAFAVIQKAHRLKESRRGHRSSGEIRNRSAELRSGEPSEEPRATKPRRLRRGQADELQRVLEGRFKSGEEFTSADLYRFEPHFQALYPENRHIKAMLRAKIQELRDRGVVEFVRHGRYRMLATA